MRIAEVIVNSQIKSLGRIYHYLAGDDVKIGARVLVPFGGNNKTCEGYCVGFVDKTDYDGELKQIKSIIDRQPILSGERLELAEYISKTCLVSMAQALRLLLPPALAVKTETRVAPTENVVGELTDVQKNVLSVLGRQAKILKSKSL